jgi:hypothetical protein
MTTRDRLSTKEAIMKMNYRTKRQKILNMIALAAEYDRRGDVVLRDQTLRTIEEAKATW